MRWEWFFSVVWGYLFYLFLVLKQMPCCLIFGHLSGSVSRFYCTILLTWAPNLKHFLKTKLGLMTSLMSKRGPYWEGHIKLSFWYMKRYKTWCKRYILDKKPSSGDNTPVLENQKEPGPSQAPTTTVGCSHFQLPWPRVNGRHYLAIQSKRPNYFLTFFYQSH